MQTEQFHERQGDSTIMCAAEQNQADRTEPRTSESGFRRNHTHRNFGRTPLEQLRRELNQVVPPVEPTVRSGAFLEYRLEAVLLEHVDGAARVRDQAVIDAGA